MVEIFFLIGLLGWLASLLFEFVYTQAYFASIAAAIVGIPLVAFWDYWTLSQRMPYRRIESAECPVPPERFYWRIQRQRLAFELIGQCLAIPAAWFFLIFYPIGEPETMVVGLAATGVAIWSGGRLLSRGTLYFNASQWFDKMTPRFMGSLRNWMYKISDNPEFLPDEPPRKKQKEKVY